MAKKKSKTQKLKKNVKKVQKKKVTTTIASKKNTTPKKNTNAKKVTSTKKLNTTKKVTTPKKKNEDIIELPKKKEYKKSSNNKGKVVSKNKVEYKIYEKQQEKKTPPRKSEIKRVTNQKPTKKIETPKEVKPEPKELNIKDIKEIKDVDLNKTINIIVPKKETTTKEKPIVAPKKEVKSTLLDKLFAKKENKKKILTTNTKNINDLKALFNGPSKKEKKESKLKTFFAKFKKKDAKKKAPVKTKEPIIELEEIEEEPKKERKVPTNPVLKFFYEILINLYIFFDVLLIATFIFLMIGLKRVEVIPNNYIFYIAGIFIFLGFFAFAYNKYISGKIFTLCLVAIMGAGIYLLQYNFDFINNLNTKEYEYKEYNVVAFDNAYNKSIYNINNKKVCLLNNNAKNEERVLNLKLDDVEYLKYDTQDEMFEDFYKGKCRAVVVTSNQIKFLANNKEKETQNVKVLYTFKANGRK